MTAKLSPNKPLSWRTTSAIVVFCVATAVASSAQTFKTLASFDNADGAQPSATVTQGYDGSFYGTTEAGGTSTVGTAYKITAAGKFTTLYEFCNQLTCNAGFGPGPLVQAANGYLYGENSQGGPLYGSIFRLTSSGTLTTVHNFDDTDGFDPVGGLVQGGDGNLYGTTYLGGAFDKGTVFKITPAGVLTMLYSFCALANCSDGAAPNHGVVEARDGNFYGTTTIGGTNGVGTVFRMTPAGVLTTLHSFDNTDGSNPGSLLQGTNGNFYGTTLQGANLACDVNGEIGCGTVFTMTPSGTLTTLYSFCAQTQCEDGYYPSGLVEATDGNFYGATELGGASGCDSLGCGTVFKITRAGILTTLHTFAGRPNDGEEPTSLVQVTSGVFYGTTFYGGAQGNGTIFLLSTDLGPFVKLVQNSGKVGQSGEILGQGFTGTTGVSINGTPATFTVASDTYLRVTVPAAATSGFVTVTTPTGVLTSNVPFTVRY